MHFVQTKGFWTPAGNVSNRHNSLGVASSCRGDLLMLPRPSILMCQTFGWKIERASLPQLPRRMRATTPKCWGVWATTSDTVTRSLCSTNEQQLQMRCWVFPSLLKCASILREQRRTIMPPQHVVSHIPARIHVRMFHACTDHSFPTRDWFQDTVYDVREGYVGKGCLATWSLFVLKLFFLISIETSQMRTLIDHCLT